MTRRHTLLTALVLLAACHTGTEPLKTPTGTQKMAKLSGDGQVSKVTVKLSAPLVAYAYLDTTHGASNARFALIPGGANFSTDTTALFNLGVPLANRDISFVVPDKACGAPFSNSEKTDATGIVKQLWTPGTKASVDCTMEARAVDQVTGQPVTYAVFHATFKAFPVTQAVVLNRDTTVHVGDTLNVTALIVKAFDQYSNENTDYLVRYQRLNSNTQFSDAVPIVGTKAVMRKDDMYLRVYTDSLYTDKRVTVLP